ncbi:hypothetical protein V2J09_016218 [Rumex salicifolius]
MHDPRESHLLATYTMLHYLKGNRMKWILFKKGKIWWLGHMLNLSSGHLPMGCGRLMRLLCDNKYAISIAHNLNQACIEEKLEDGLITISYIPSEEQTTNVLTKGLHSSRIHRLISMLGMEDVYHPI